MRGTLFYFCTALGRTLALGQCQGKCATVGITCSFDLRVHGVDQ